jgi:hypothetical protein
LKLPGKKERKEGEEKGGKREERQRKKEKMRGRRERDKEGEGDICKKEKNMQERNVILLLIHYIFSLFFTPLPISLNRTQRATMRLLVENFSEGLYVVFSAEAGLEALGSKVVAELTKIRQAERKVMTFRDELQAEEVPMRYVAGYK